MKKICILAIAALAMVACGKTYTAKTLEELEEALIMADVGVETSMYIIETLR